MKKAEGEITAAEKEAKLFNGAKTDINKIAEASAEIRASMRDMIKDYKKRRKARERLKQHAARARKRIEEQHRAMQQTIKKRISLKKSLVNRLGEIGRNRPVDRLGWLGSQFAAGWADFAAKSLRQHTRIFVYELPARFNSEAFAAPRDAKQQGLAEAEARVHQLFLHDNPLRTMDPHQATLFFVPVYPVSFCTHQMVACASGDGSKCREFPHIDGCEPGKMLMLEAVQWINSSFGFWGRNNGSDHVFMAFYDFGPCMEFKPWKAAEQGVATPLQPVHFLTYLGDRGQNKGQCYRAIQDVVMPVWINRTTFSQTANAKKLLVYFRGTNSKAGRATEQRRQMFWLNSGRSGINKDKAVLVTQAHVDLKTYAHELASSTFCLAPIGWTLWTYRFFEAIAAGCIPIIFDNFRVVLPFETEINWDAAILRIPTRDEHNTMALIDKMSPAELSRRHQALEQVRTFMHGDKMMHLVLWELFKVTNDRANMARIVDQGGR